MSLSELQIKLNLCIHDKRNPNYDPEMYIINKGECMCDNCYYGRNVLAKEILKLRLDKHNSK